MIRIRGMMKEGRHGRVRPWPERNPLAAAVILFAVCLLGLVALFVFLVFSDFSSSADFVYNSF